MRAIMVSVDFSDILSLTLPYNAHHFDEVNIVTTPSDAANVCPIADRVQAATGVCINVLTTELFYADGAKFAKWRALEDSLDRIGRRGWLCLIDADVLWPRENTRVYELGNLLRPGFLYSPMRHMMTDLPLGFSAKDIPPEPQWSRFPIHRNINEWAGFTQVFHAEDPHLGPPPWHQINYTSAGTADSFFQAKWPRECKIRLPFNVLHLGPAGVNWCGRVSNYLDGSTPAQAKEREQTLREMRAKRKGPDPFRHERIEGR